MNQNTKYLHQTQQQLPMMKWIWEKNYEENVPTGLSAQRNIPPSSTIFEEESKNKLSQIRYQEKYPQYDDDYYKSGSINYKGYEYNQNRTTQEKQQNEFKNNIKNFKEIQNINTQTTQQEQTNANYQKSKQNENETQQIQKPQQNERKQLQTRRNQREWRNERSYSRNSDTSSYNTRNSRSNSRYRGNQNYKRNNQNQRQYNNINQYNRNQKQNNTYIPNRNQQRENYSKQSITKQMLQEQEKQQEQTCKYWKNGTCRNYECQKKHYEMIKIMNMHHKPKSKRIKNNVIDQNALQKEIGKQQFNVIIETTRQMNINEIQEYIAKKSQKLDQQEISNIKIKIAIKNNKNIKQEIQDIKNLFLLEYEKDKDTINLTQAELISTNEILNQIKKEEFVNIRQAFSEYNKEQEYENEKFREKLSNIIEKMREEKNKKNKEMEVEDNNVRISQTINTYKPNIQDNQFKNIQFGQQIQQSINISEEDKVNKQNTSSGEEINNMNTEKQMKTQLTEKIEKQEINEIPQQQIIQNDKITQWKNVQVDSSYVDIQNKEGLLKESILIIEKAKLLQKIAFTKLTYKMHYKEYLTYQKIDLNKDAKEIPTGAYLILLIDANYINDIKSKIISDQDPSTLQVRIAAFAESISTHAIETVQYRLESDKVKLNSSRQLITQAIVEIITSKKEYTNDEIHQIKAQTNQALNINVIIHITLTLQEYKEKMTEIQRKDENKIQQKNFQNKKQYKYNCCLMYINLVLKYIFFYINI